MTTSLLDAEEAARIAQELTTKYGRDALDFVASRAERALQVGDDLAFDAWQSVLGATRAVLERCPAASLS